MTNRILVLALLCLALSGCAAQRFYTEGQRLIDQGQFEEGLGKFNEAAKIDPGNNEYRAAYFRHRESISFRLLNEADSARSKERWEEAEALYFRVLRMDPENVRAKSEIASLATERRHLALLREAEELLKKDEVDKASQKIRQVLSENPAHRNALSLQHKIDEKVRTAAPADSFLKSSFKKPITLEFRDATLQAICEVISKTAGINFIFDKDVNPDLHTTIFVRSAYLEDAIRFILVTNQLESKVLNESTLLIYPNTPQKARDFQELTTRSFYISNADVKQTANMIKSLVKTKDIFVDEKLNLLVMRDTPEAVRMAEKLISAQDLAESEVMLAVEILEVSSSLVRDLGIKYPDQISYSLAGAAGVAGTLKLTELINRNASLVNVTVSNPALTVNLRDQLGDTNLLANPRIRVRNREKAKIHIGDKVPVITSTSTSTGFVSESVSYLDVGLKLDVEPVVYLDDEVAIKIGLEVSNIAREIVTTSGSLTYQVGTRSASTTLRLKDGETQILAGLISNEDRKTITRVPGLGQLPLIGRLFSNNHDNEAKTEVVLLITPRIVRNLIRPNMQIEEFSSGTEAMIGARPLELRSDPVRQEKTEKAVSEPSATPSPPALPSGAKVTLDFPSQVSMGNQYTLDVNLAADSVQSAIFELSYNPSLLQVVKVDEGEFMKQAGGDTRFIYQTQDKAGRISVNAGGAGNAKGNGKVAMISFKVIGNHPEKDQLMVTALNLSDAAGKPVSTAIPPGIEVNFTK